MLLLTVSLSLAAPSCPATPAELTAAVDDAEKAFASMDITGLRSGVDDAVLEVACLSAVLPPVTAAKLHRGVALRSFVTGDESGARRALLAARVLDPTGEYPVSVIPADHPLRKLDPGVPAVTPATIAVTPPSAGLVYFDGHNRFDRPSDRPTAYQLIGSRGDSLAGAYLLPEDPMPAYPVSAVVATTTTTATTVEKKSHLSIPLAIIGGLGLAGAGVTYALAGESNKTFYEAGKTEDEIRAAYDQTNTMVYTSAALATIGLGTGVTAVVVGKW